MCGCGGGGGQGGVDVLPQKRCIFVWGEKCDQEKVMDICDSDVLQILRAGSGASMVWILRKRRRWFSILAGLEVR